jgi:prepilin-type processing-associated H-X9-DG protein
VAFKAAVLFVQMPPLKPARQGSESTGASVPPLIEGDENEGPSVLVLTNSGTIVDERVSNNPIDHVEDTISNHPQAVNCLFGDGSVRIINNDVDPALWVSAATRAGGEAQNIQ